MAYIKNTRRFVRALQEATRLREKPTFVADHGCIGQALEQQRAILDRQEKIRGAFMPEVACAG